jgi:fucose permease
MPAILEYYDLGYNQGGMLLSAQSIGNLLTSMMVGVMSIYFGRKNTIVVLSSMTLLGLIGIMITKSQSMLLIFFFMTGVGRGSVSNVSNTIVNDKSDGNTALLNILHTFFAVGAFMAPLLASWFFLKGLSWKFSIGIVAVLALIMVLVFILMKLKSSDSEKVIKVKDKKISYEFLKSLEFYTSCAILFFYVGAEYAVNGWIVTYLTDTGIMSAALGQRILSILWIIIIFGRLSVAYISRLVDKKNILVGSSIGTMIFFTLFLMSKNTWVIIFSVFGLGLCLSGIYPTTIANVGDKVKGSGLAMGILLGSAGIGGIIMPYVTGVVADKRGIAGGMTTISVAIFFLFLSTLVNKLIYKNEKVQI